MNEALRKLLGEPVGEVCAPNGSRPYNHFQRSMDVGELPVGAKLYAITDRALEKADDARVEHQHDSGRDPCQYCGARPSQQHYPDCNRPRDVAPKRHIPSANVSTARFELAAESASALGHAPGSSAWWKQIRAELDAPPEEHRP